jgi:hypothetical protein
MVNEQTNKASLVCIDGIVERSSAVVVYCINICTSAEEFVNSI